VGEAEDLKPGQRLDQRYELVQRLGAGGYGVVWQARELAAGREVALKILHPQVRDDPRAVERLGLEAALLSSLEHPNIARALAFQASGSHVYLAMEFVPGRTLARVIEEAALAQRFPPLGRVLARMRAIGAGLHHAHAKGVVHRDVKPHNVMVSSEADGERVKVLDFGIAKVLDGDVFDATTLGRRVGSTLYMAPEQIRGLPAEPRSDVFALGAMLYELLTLRRAWARDARGEPLGAFVASLRTGPNSFAEVFERILGAPRPRPSEVRPELPPAVDRVVIRALADAPEARFDSALALVEALEASLVGVELASPRTEATAVAADVELAEAVRALGIAAGPRVPTATLPPRPALGGAVGLPPEQSSVAVLTRLVGVDPVEAPRADTVLVPRALEATDADRTPVAPPAELSVADTRPEAAAHDRPFAAPSPWPGADPRLTPVGPGSGFGPGPAPGAIGYVGRWLPALAVSLAALAVVVALRAGGRAPVGAGEVRGPSAPAAPGAVPGAPREAPERAEDPPPPSRAEPVAGGRAEPRKPETRSPRPSRRPSAEPSGAPSEAAVEAGAEAPSPSGTQRALRRMLERAKARPDDAALLGQLADRIAREADRIGDRAVRTRVKRLAASSALVGDIGGVELALDTLSEAL
jgi:tRNA A-37 threonylcarbamoyl transferase component Bud32